MNQEQNPLLSEDFRIPFRRITADDVEPGIREALRRGEEEIEALAADDAPRSWDNTLERLDRVTQWVGERIKPATHLLAVDETQPLREAYNAVLPEISSFWARLGLHEGLWRQVKAYAETDEAAGLDPLRRRHLDKTILEFRRAGADLPPDDKAHLEKLRVDLAQLEQRFSENVLDATAAWELLVTDEERLEGMPAGARARARARAEAEGKEGWLIGLDYPSVEPVLKYARDRALRREVHEAYVGRCRGGEWDNRPLLVEILRLRHELARLLGYEDFPDYRLEDHMVKSGARAIAFEAEMEDLTRRYWERDVSELREHARTLGLDALMPWDVAFVQERLRKARYDIDDEDLRPYFPLEGVMAGLFQIVERVFGLRVSEAENDQVWNEAVRYYEIRDERGTWLGAFYTDWFPRKEKRQGAWMNDLITGGPRPDGGFDPHLGVICGNFTPPEGERPALLTHREVQTIFHEFGHLLHHCTSRVAVRARSGLSVPWDWVELPSQFMENWTWEREALDLFAHHWKTGEPLPDELFQRLVRARRFMGGWAQMRQISFGSVDLALHEELAPRENLEADEVMAFAEERFLPFSPDRTYARLHTLPSFTHLFSGGYAAGYYSYLWSEVLDADAFTRFRDEGIFNPSTGKDYMDSILSKGDADDPERLFRRFMGRDPDPSALVERNLGPEPEPATP